MSGCRALAILVLLVSSTAAGTARAVDPTRPLSGYSVDSWGARDGLPGAWVRALAQSADGYLWVGTQGGLARLGGGRLAPIAPGGFEQAADIVAAHPLRDGSLWLVPSRGAPVCVRAGALAPCQLGGQPLPAGARVTAVHEDREGTLWLALPDGVHRFAGGRLTRVHDASAWNGAAVSALGRDGRGRLWIGTALGLFVAENAAPRLHAAAGTPVMSLFVAGNERVWVALDDGLLRIEGAETATVWSGDHARGQRATQVIEDHDGCAWLGTRAGLLRVRPGQAPVLFTRADGMPDDDVSALLEDREGSLWVGTRGGGLAQFTDRTLDGLAGPPGLRDRWISSVAEDGAGALWVGSPRGLTRWSEGREVTYTQADGLPSDEVLSVLPAPDGTLWIGTDRGVARLREGRIDLPVQLPDAVPSLYLDREGTLWIGADGGLARLRQGHLERVPVEPALQGTSLSEIRGIQHDDQGVLWVSAGGKLLQLAGGVLGRAAGEAPGKVRSLFRDSDGTLWLGTHDGLVRRRGGAWRTFGSAEGLGPGDLFQVVSDDLGNLWVGAGQGILRVSKASLDEVDRGQRQRADVVWFETSDQRRAVAATRTRQPGAWRARDGRLWFAAARGVISVNPRRLRVNGVPPGVVIEEALVDGRAARAGGENRFPAGPGVLQFAFAALTLIEPQKAQFRYRLEGVDAGWVEAGARRTATYGGVRPGAYRFLVQASNADGVWSEPSAPLAFVLAPHLYQRPWFFPLCALGAITLAFALHRLRVMQLHGRYAAATAERTRVARELHDSLLQGMAGTVILLRGLRKRFGPGAEPPAPQAVTDEIRTIEEVVATNMEETRRFLWDLRDQPGPAPDLGHALEQMVERLTRPGAVQARVHLEGALTPLPQHARRELLLIAQEALSNALKHARASTIEVRLRGEPGGGVTLSVRDDGQGFDPQHVPGTEEGHFGLRGMRERAAALGALSIVSRPGEGTRVEVTVKDQHV